MRTTLLTLALVMAGGLAWGQAASINWMSLEEAVAAQQKEPRKIMMDVYTQWCGPCKMMMANTFTNRDLIKYVNEHYYAVKFDAESPDPVTFRGNEFKNPDYDPNRRGRNAVHELSRALNVNAYPTVVYFDEQANVIAPISGYKQVRKMELYLKFFEEAWKGNDQAAWDAFQQSFKPQWRLDMTAQGWRTFITSLKNEITAQNIDGGIELVEETRANYFLSREQKDILDAVATNLMNRDFEEIIRILEASK